MLLAGAAPAPAPVPAPPDAETSAPIVATGQRLPVRRLGRYTCTAGYEMQAGSHLTRRSRRARVAYLDLSSDPAAPAKAP